MKNLPLGIIGFLAITATGSSASLETSSSSSYVSVAAAQNILPELIFDLVKVDQPPRPKKRTEPIYPFALKREGATGEVIVEFIVDVTGDVQNAVAVRKSSRREFDEAAIKAVSQWKFSPGIKDGHAVATRLQVPIRFTLSAK